MSTKPNNRARTSVEDDRRTMVGSAHALANNGGRANRSLRRRRPGRRRRGRCRPLAAGRRPAPGRRSNTNRSAH
eukprot:7602680-Lingulodinium_polyedra.AAC.1